MKVLIHPTSRSSSQANGRRAEEGSAYLVVLLVLLVLMVLGVSLALTSQMELWKGDNQRTIERLLYAADSGLGVGVMRMMVDGHYESFDFRIDDEATAITLTSRVSVSPVVPTAQTPCHLCQINQGSEFFQIQHQVTSTATREGWRTGADPEADATPLGRKTVSSSIRIQPWRSTPAAHDFTDEDLAKLRM